MAYNGKHKIPDGVAGDMLMLTEIKGEIFALLIDRKNEPKGYAIPGGFLDPNENLQACAIREAEEETNLVIPSSEARLIGVYSDPLRDPRGRIVSAAYGCFVEYGRLKKARAADDALSVDFVSIADIANGKATMAFDHKKIVEDGLRKLKPFLPEKERPEAFFVRANPRGGFDVLEKDGDFYDEGEQDSLIASFGDQSAADRIASLLNKGASLEA